jgi:hypothetical protein
MGVAVVEYLRCLSRELDDAEASVLGGFEVNFTHIF